MLILDIFISNVNKREIYCHSSCAQCNAMHCPCTCNGAFGIAEFPVLAVQIANVLGLIIGRWPVRDDQSVGRWSRDGRGLPCVPSGPAPACHTDTKPSGPQRDETSGGDVSSSSSSRAHIREKPPNKRSGVAAVGSSLPLPVRPDCAEIFGWIFFFFLASEFCKSGVCSGVRKGVCTGAQWPRR